MGTTSSAGVTGLINSTVKGIGSRLADNFGLFNDSNYGKNWRGY